MMETNERRWLVRRKEKGKWWLKRKRENEERSPKSIRNSDFQGEVEETSSKSIRNSSKSIRNSWSRKNGQK
jgi:hypothetical protein